MNSTQNIDKDILILKLKQRILELKSKLSAEEKISAFSGKTTRAERKQLHAHINDLDRKLKIKRQKKRQIYLK